MCWPLWCGCFGWGAGVVGVVGAVEVVVVVVGVVEVVVTEGVGVVLAGWQLAVTLDVGGVPGGSIWAGGVPGGALTVNVICCPSSSVAVTWH